MWGDAAATAAKIHILVALLGHPQQGRLFKWMGERERFHRRIH